MSEHPHGPNRSQTESLGAEEGITRSASGSVKRARQRVEAGVPHDQPRRPHEANVDRSASPGIGTPRQRLEQGDYGQGSSQGHSQRPVPPEGLYTGLGDNGLVVSRSSPSPIPEWPLRKEDESSRRRNNSPTNERPKAKGPPPQRPPRPSFVPPIVDILKVQGKTQFYNQRLHHLQNPQVASQQQPHYWENSRTLSPGQELGTPGTVGTGTSSSSSRLSTSSSIGSIPEFPTPNTPTPLPPQQTRRSANLGPPPSSRRGASSYYSQSSYVTPIPEELPEYPNAQNPHGSYASSHLMPTSWGDGPPEYYLGEGVGEQEEEVPEGENGREPRGSDHDESTGLVRKASLGKRHKPCLTTIRSSDGSDKDGAIRTFNNNHQSGVDTEKPKLVSRAAVPSGATGGAFAAGPGSSRNEQVISEDGAFDGGTGFLDNSSSSNGSAFKSPTSDVTFSASDPRPRSPVTAAVDEKVKQIMGGLKKGGALESGTPSPVTSPALLAGDKLLKRPPRLNIDAAKSADARASLTSLPELIRRATKLASNLDRGRTASRLGMRDVGPADAREKALSPNGRPRSGSISHILASFPPPGLSTPTPTSDRPVSRWPSPFANPNLAMGRTSSVNGDAMDFNEKNQTRKCCGMPIWGFALLLIILVFLIAAAVVIPVTLIVLPRQRTASLDAAAAADLTNCQNSTPCANGGTSIVTANACSCICANGFTGPTCNQIADAGCITTNIESNDQFTSRLTNVTLGSSIPRLLSAAQSNFSIPLNSSRILSMFSAANLSCTAENALVTFNSQSQRRSLSILKSNIDLVLSMPHRPSPTVFPRQASSPSLSFSVNAGNYPASTVGVYTSNGLILAGSTSVAPTVATPIGTATASTASSAPPAGTNQPISRHDLDFARVAVLYIFQQTKLEEAVLAQEKLQAFFVGGGFNGSSLDVGGSMSVDFGKGTVNLGNGTVVGVKVG